MLKRLLNGVIGLSFLAFLSGCAATDAALTSDNLNVETKMSSSIFLEPVAPEKRTVLVQVRNTSGQPNLNLEPMIRSTLEQRGYRIVEDPAQAQYMLQANVLQVGEADKETIDKFLSSGYGGAAIGGLIGTGVGALAGGHSDALIGGALAGAAIGYLANTLVKDNAFTMVTDLQVSERVGGGNVSASSQHNLKQGTSGSTSTSYKEESQWKQYQTRVVSTANKVNLTVQEATAGVSTGLAQSIAGIF